MMVDHQPLVPDTLEDIRGQYASLLRFIGLLTCDVFHTDHPGHVARHLHHHFREFELHREGVVEDQHPGITHGRPVGAEGPAGMHASDIFKMRPDLVHLGDVETFKGFVEFQVGFGDFFDALFQHARPHDKRSAGICVVLGPKKASTYSREYASGLFEPAASHLPASPSPCHKGLLGQTASKRAIILESDEGERGEIVAGYE